MQSPIVQESCPGAPYHIRTQITYARFLTSITSRSHDEDDADQSSLLTVTVVTDARIPPLHCGSTRTWRENSFT